MRIRDAYCKCISRVEKEVGAWITRTRRDAKDDGSSSASSSVGTFREYKGRSSLWRSLSGVGFALALERLDEEDRGVKETLDTV